MAYDKKTSGDKKTLRNKKTSVKKFGNNGPMPKRKQKITRLSGLTEGLIGPALSKKSAQLGQIIAYWPHIVGPISDWARPVSLHPPRHEKDEGVLAISILSGRGPEAQMRQSEIRDLINGYFGYALIGKLQIKQDLILDKAEKQASNQTAGMQHPPLPAAKSSDDSASSEQPTLKAALDRLGKTLAKKGRI